LPIIIRGFSPVNKREFSAESGSVLFDLFAYCFNAPFNLQFIFGFHIKLEFFRRVRQTVQFSKKKQDIKSRFENLSR
jgi:hypothetical protein